MIFKKEMEMLQPIPVPQKMWSQIDIDHIGPVKEIEGHNTLLQLLTTPESLLTWTH